MQNYAIDYKNTDLKIVKAYQIFLDNIDSIKAHLETRIDGVKASSTKQFEYIRQISIG